MKTAWDRVPERILKLRRIVVWNAPSFYQEHKSTPAEALAQLQDAIAKIPPDAQGVNRPQFIIEVSDGDRQDVSATAYIGYETLETEEERSERLALVRGYDEQKAEVERKEFERLKKKFEPAPVPPPAPEPGRRRPIRGRMFAGRR